MVGHGNAGQWVDPVLAPNWFGVVQLLGPEHLDGQVAWHGICPSLPAPAGVPWSEYIGLWGWVRVILILCWGFGFGPCWVYCWESGLACGVSGCWCWVISY